MLKRKSEFWRVKYAIVKISPIAKAIVDQDGTTLAEVFHIPRRRWLIVLPGKYIDLRHRSGQCVGFATSEEEILGLYDTFVKTEIAKLV
jgi:hypothetical protein